MPAVAGSDWPTSTRAAFHEPTHGSAIGASQPLDQGSGTVCQPGFASPTMTSENFAGSWSCFCSIDTAAHSDYFVLMRLLNTLIHSLYHSQISVNSHSPTRKIEYLKLYFSRISHFSNFALYASLRIKCKFLFAFYFALYTWLDFALSHFRTSHFIIAQQFQNPEPVKSTHQLENRITVICTHQQGVVRWSLWAGRTLAVVEVDQISASVSVLNVDKLALPADVRFRPKAVVQHSVHVWFRQAAVGKFGGCWK